VTHLILAEGANGQILTVYPCFGWIAKCHYIMNRNEIIAKAGSVMDSIRVK
jgi:hypothetical protein